MNSKFKIQNSKLWLTAVAMVFALVGSCLQAEAQGKTNTQTDKSGTPKVDTVVVKLNAPKVSGNIEPDSIGIGDRFLYSIEVE
jgi:hypothetical protein